MNNRSFTTAKGTELPFLDIKGKPYLSVQHRIVWFREEKPDWSIETEFLERTPDKTTAKATIRDPTGRILAMGHKSETKQGFKDHAEKAESSAVGRALAFLGYGTAYALELEEGEERLADAPVESKRLHTNERLLVVNKNPSDIFNYTVAFGKNNGRPLSDFETSELEELISKTEKYCEDKEDPPHEMIEFLDIAHEFLQKLPAKQKATSTQFALLENIAKKKGMDKKQLDHYLMQKFNTVNLDQSQLDTCISELTKSKP
jgi:hypothetical protein